jgi:hypothetical protein
MTIKDYKEFLNSLPDEFDSFEITHREYTTIDGDILNAQALGVYSVHIDEEEKVACNMHFDSYEMYQSFIDKTK